MWFIKCHISIGRSSIHIYSTITTLQQFKASCRQQGLQFHVLKEFAKCLAVIAMIPRRTIISSTYNQTENQQAMFQKHVSPPPWCKIQIYLLCRSKPCPKQVSKGLKYIKWTTHCAQKDGLTFTFEHVTWKSIGNIYLLITTPWSSVVLIKWRGQKILSGQHTGLKRVVWILPLNMWPENLGIIYLLGAIPAPSLVLMNWRGQYLKQLWCLCC